MPYLDMVFRNLEEVPKDALDTRCRGTSTVIGLSRTDVQDALRRARPAEVRAILGDGSEQLLDIPTSHKRWQVLAGQVERVRAQRLELVDIQGTIVDVIQAERPPEMAPDAQHAIAAGGVMLSHVLAGLAPLTQALTDRDATIAESYTRLIEAIQAENHVLRDRVAELESKVAESESVQGSPEMGKFLETISSLAPHALTAYLAKHGVSADVLST